MTNSVSKYSQTPMGTYSISVEDGLAKITILRRCEKDRFKLSEILAAKGFSQAGRFQIKTQIYYYHAPAEKTVFLYANKWEKFWRQLRGQPLTQTTTYEETRMGQGPQKDLPEGAIFDFAYTVLMVPVKPK